MQMWAFIMVHELPYDDPEALRRRLKIRYPIRIDRAIGGGRLPNSRLQELLMRPSERISVLDRVLTFAHWAWFFEPHLSLIYILARDDRAFVRAARQMAGAFDLGCAIYVLVPTAPPWWAAENGYTGEDKIHRRMLDVGEETWGRAWPKLYDSVDGNPWAAMPSLHFGASVLAAMLLSESNPRAGAVGWTYAGTLGLALVYLGEHYVIDLIAGLGLVARRPARGAARRAVRARHQRRRAAARKDRERLRVLHPGAEVRGCARCRAFGMVIATLLKWPRVGRMRRSTRSPQRSLTTTRSPRSSRIPAGWC